MSDASIAARIEVSAEAFEPEVLMREFRLGLGVAVGAVACFTGLARSCSADASANGAVRMLRLWQYEGFTARRIGEIAGIAVRRWDLLDFAIRHRYGEIEPGEAIVFVMAASVRRRDAFEAADFLMDHLKTDAPFWKQECRDGEWFWIEPGRRDRVDRARWDDRQT